MDLFTRRISNPRIYGDGCNPLARRQAPAVDRRPVGEGTKDRRS